jgi:RimJ/RimL family protein N-acetyltransferase
MEIREATVLDLADMVVGGKKFLQFICPDKKIDESNLYGVLHKLVTQGIVFLAVKDGEVIGGIGGNIVASTFWPEDILLHEVFWWVNEEHRGSSAALRLMKRFIDHGKAQPDISQIVMSMETISPLSDDAYLKRGFELKEKAFVMEV